MKINGLVALGGLSVLVGGLYVGYKKRMAEPNEPQVTFIAHVLYTFGIGG